MDFLQKPLTAATIEDATRFYEWLRAKNYSLASQKQKLDIVGGLFEFAREMEVVTRNPFRLIQRPKAKATLSERILTPDEVQRLIAAADTERNKALLQMLYFYGDTVSTEQIRPSIATYPDGEPRNWQPSGESPEQKLFRGKKKAAIRT